MTFGEADMAGPAWLDHDTLLVAGNTADDRDMDPVESEIYAVELSDLSLRALTTRDGPDHSPVVSPMALPLPIVAMTIKSYLINKTIFI